jgi:23S rRNA (cytosine1962-C5)-methyltransferase
MGEFEFIAADVKQLLPFIAPDSYDIIVMDPPTFSNSKKMKDILDIQEDHVSLIHEALRILVPGGILFFSTNARKFELNRSAIQGAEIKDITAATTPFDFEGKLMRWCWEMVKL